MNKEIIEKKSFDYIKSHKKDFLNFYLQDKKLILGTKTNFFTAGSPGAGKTEFIKELAIIKNKNIIKPLHIDADIIRTEFLKDFYKPADLEKNISGNAQFLQKAAIKGVEFLLDYCFKNNILFILDGTMGGGFETVEKNILRCLNKGIEPVVFYLYQDPLIAWNYTKKREKVEGRNILKTDFVRHFFKSRENVNSLKKKHGGKLILNLIIKDFLNRVEKYYTNIDNVDFYVKSRYNGETLENILK